MQDKYRIGSMAEELGVTSSFIKNCEKYGILETYVEDNGYRNYSFNQASRLIEFLKLQNQGFSGKEIRRLMFESSAAEVVEYMTRREQEMDRDMSFRMALKEYYDFARRSMPKFESNQWYIEERGDFYFIKHTNQAVFLGDEDTKRVIKDWNQWLPVVCSTLKGENINAEPSVYWGFSVSSGFARSQELLTAQPVEYVPGRRCIVQYSKREMGGGRVQGLAEVLELAARLGLKPAGEYYEHIFLKLWENGSRYQYSVCELPVE